MTSQKNIWIASQTSHGFEGVSKFGIHAEDEHPKFYYRSRYHQGRWGQEWKDMVHNFINEALEGWESIANSIRHNQKLIMVFMCVQYRLMNVNLFHADLVVSEWRSSLVKKLEPWSSSRRSSMTRMGNLSFIVNLLRAWKLGDIH